MTTRFACALFIAFALLLSMSCNEKEVTNPTPEALNIPDDPDCDPLVPEVCAMPFPSSKWLKTDPARTTGYTLTFGLTTLPANMNGTHIDPTPYARLDGFGVGVPALAFFANLDTSNIPNETRIADTMAADSTLMLFEVTNGVATRIPCWAELDGSADTDDKRALIIRPAVLLKEGTRYIVALRGLKQNGGTPVPSSDAFIALRDSRAVGTPVADRIARFEEIFAMLKAASVPRESLTLAWDWVTASGDTLHGPLLHMRDEAFAQLGDATPALAITSVQTFTPDQNVNIAYEVEGTFDVPDYTVHTTVAGVDGYLLNWGPDGLPAQNGVYKADFRARIPRTALNGAPAAVMVHGHGLNGSDTQIEADYFDDIAQKENVIIAGCNMLGMSSEDVPGILQMLSDFSAFPIIGDRLHQGVLDHAFLIRALKKGFDKLPEIAAMGVTVDPTQIFYNGISQGGIFGGTHMAMSLDVTRGHLGVPGNNYSTLLQRSKDFAGLFLLVYINYPDARDQQLDLAIIQNLWDRTDPVSHYRHISAEPYPNTPTHQVLLASAQGDWQVAPITNENVARSNIGISVLANYGRDIPLVTETAYPLQGSGIVSYSFGNPWATPGNHPPEDDVGDPHGKPRTLPWHNDQMFHFYRTGEIEDVCGGDGCTPQ